MSQCSPTPRLPQIRKDIGGGRLEKDAVAPLAGHQSACAPIDDVARPGDILGMIEPVQSRTEISGHR